MSFFIFGKVEILLFPNLLNFVKFFFVFELLDGFIYNLSNNFFILLEIECKNLIEGHCFDRNFKRVSSLFHEFFPMPISDWTVLKLNNKWDGILESQNFFIKLIVNNVSSIFLRKLSFKSVEQFIKDFLQEFSIKLNP